LVNVLVHPTLYNQFLADGQWFSPGTPASSTTKTGRHDIAEILLKVALKHQKSNQNQINQLYTKGLTIYSLVFSKLVSVCEVF
jgi:hypothetical protein